MNIHRRLCKILLSSYESLQTMFSNFLTQMPGTDFSLGLYLFVHLLLNLFKDLVHFFKIQLN